MSGQSELEVLEVEAGDAGIYECVVDNGGRPVIQTHQVGVHHSFLLNTQVFLTLGGDLLPGRDLRLLGGGEGGSGRHCSAPLQSFRAPPACSVLVQGRAGGGD